MATRATQNKGFVLLLALVLLALAGTVASAVARQSSALALQANSRQEALQRRWAMTSLQHSFGPRMEQIVLGAEAEAKGPVHWLRRRIRINGADFELIFGDEQARANVNAICERRGRLGLIYSLRRLLSESSRTWRVELRRESAGTPEGDEAGQPFQSFAQLLSDCGPGSLVEPFGDQAPPVHNITCWGDGRINFRRATRAALAEAADGILSYYQQAQLLLLRREIPGISIQEALRRLELTDRELSQAAAVLTDRSACYSLWIVMRTPNRCWHRLAIYRMSPGSSEAQPIRTFTW